MMALDLAVMAPARAGALAVMIPEVVRVTAEGQETAAGGWRRAGAALELLLELLPGISPCGLSEWGGWTSSAMLASVRIGMSGTGARRGRKAGALSMRP